MDIIAPTAKLIAVYSPYSVANQITKNITKMIPPQMRYYCLRN